MGNKLRNALFEIYVSEKHYVKDIKMWYNEFKNLILEANFINTSKRTWLNEYIFGNLGEIVDLHVEIFDDMKKLYIKMNLIDQNTNDLNYKVNVDLDILCIGQLKIFIKKFKRFDEYIDYFKNLPHALDEYERMYYTVGMFKKLVDKFLRKRGVFNLGSKNFILRPINKLLRYPLLLESVLDKLKNKDLSIICKNLIKHFDVLIEKSNYKYKECLDTLTKFNILLMYRFKNLSDLYPIGLLYKNYTSIEYKLTIRGRLPRDKLIRKKYVIILTNCILICKENENKFVKRIIETKPLFFSQVFLEEKNSDNEFQILINDINNKKRLVTFYFNNYEERQPVSNLLKKLIYKTKTRLSNQFKLIKLNYMPKDEIISSFKIDSYFLPKRDFVIKKEQETFSDISFSNIDEKLYFNKINQKRI
ncbi:hypothetical protein HERIO_857 [Hepatospora eriocheir]|uniref:DH domain-containing protein n=1 Tax=Hepatospora eriocheir TaxID=1081669 RepID=A0A1X0QC07_9MICR|nr:hypothetical protein HERIO_857 [Hepatospora eriocheir]